MHGVKRGVLITFEGVECSGKSTQAEALATWLAERDLPHVHVRDPGTTAIGEDIRNILLNARFRDMHKKCEVLLFLAARAQLTYEKLLPAIESRKIVWIRMTMVIARPRCGGVSDPANRKIPTPCSRMYAISSTTCSTPRGPKAPK